jgi:hypothetical protein
VSAMQTVLAPSAAALAAASSCRLCKADWGQMGAVCAHCRAKGALRAYRGAWVAAREQRAGGGGEADAGDAAAAAAAAPRTASGRRKREGKARVPGAAGDADAFLRRAGGGGGGDDDDGGDAARAELADAFLTETALQRVLRALARLGGADGKGGEWRDAARRGGARLCR